MATDEELLHLRRMRARYLDRKRVLEEEQARSGPRMPAEAVVELRECEESIERIDAKLKIVTVPTEVQEATGPEASIDVLRQNVKDLREFFHSAMRAFNDQLIDMREETRDYRKIQDAERARGQRERRTVELVIAIVAIAALYIAIVH
jgi:hypothetical protein